MKYFAFISFLFLSITLSAQMIMQEIAYVPSPSGYYNNLIVRGNVNINNLISETFEIYSYSSIFNIQLKDPSSLYFNNINVSHKQGSVFLSESKYDNFLNILSSSTVINEPWAQDKGGGSGNPKTTDYAIPINLNGGSVSISNVQDSEGRFTLRSIQSGVPIPNVTIYTDNISDTNSPSVYVKNLSIFGMDIPKCPYNYYWQKVMVGNDVYTVLACNTTTCSNPEKEEYCIQNNQCWSSSSCNCADCSTPIPPGGYDD